MTTIKNKNIAYHQTTLSENERAAVLNLLNSGHLDAGGIYSQQCTEWLKALTQSKLVLLTHSCTAALEMSAILADIQPGDEVIMPSFTFVSTATAFVMRGAVPVFVDMNPMTLNIDADQIAAAVTNKTKAIVPMHYAAMACDMAVINDIAGMHNLLVIEDAAQCVMASYQGKALGTFGAMGAYSFHFTKNLTSGLGGALLINDERFIDRAKIVWQKGTNREAFIEGKVDKYTWVDQGSSYMMNELGAAFLWGQMQSSAKIQSDRMAVWQKYHDFLQPLEVEGHLRRPIVPDGCIHNAHIYYVLANTVDSATGLIRHLRSVGIDADRHYVPLHLSPAAKHYGRQSGNLKVSETLSRCLVRLPLWPGMFSEVERIVESIGHYFAR